MAAYGVLVRFVRKIGISLTLRTFSPKCHITFDSLDHKLLYEFLFEASISLSYGRPLLLLSRRRTSFHWKTLLANQIAGIWYHFTSLR